MYIVKISKKIQFTLFFWEINKKRALLKNLYAIIGFDAPI